MCSVAAQGLRNRDRAAAGHALDQDPVLRSATYRAHRREPGARVDQRAVGGKHVGEVGRRLGTNGRAEHPQTLDRRDRDVQLGEPIVGVRPGPWPDLLPGLERADEDTEWRGRPLELPVDLVDERAPDQARDHDTGDDERRPDHDEGSDESMSQRHVSPVEARSRRRGPS